MAVNVFKDTTFYKVLASGWDDSERPSAYGNKEIVLVVDESAWYVWCADTENNGANAGWYLQE